MFVLPRYFVCFAALCLKKFAVVGADEGLTHLRVVGMTFGRFLCLNWLTVCADPFLGDKLQLDHAVPLLPLFLEGEVCWVCQSRQFLTFFHDIHMYIYIYVYIIGIYLYMIGISFIYILLEYTYYIYIYIGSLIPICINWNIFTLYCTTGWFGT